jgi:hypothetical protein
MCFSYAFFFVFVFSLVGFKTFMLRIPKSFESPQICSGKSFHPHPPHLNQESPGQGQTLVFDQGSQGWP